MRSSSAGLPPKQRKKVILIGVLAALVLRIIFALIVTQLLQIVGLVLAGGLLLLWVAWRMYRELRGASENPGSEEVLGDEHRQAGPVPNQGDAGQRGNGHRPHVDPVRGRHLLGRDRQEGEAEEEAPLARNRGSAVGFAVRDVVDQVHNAGEDAEDRERRHGIRERPRLQQLLAEHQRGEDDEVLGPLIRSQRNEQARRR